MALITGTGTPSLPIVSITSDNLRVSILTKAEDNINILISGITVAGGYNYNWGTVNQNDLAKCTFPAAMAELDPEETNLDTPDGIHAGAYLNEAGFKIRIVGQIPQETTNPVYEINKVLNKALDDLKQVFGTEPGASLNDNVDLMQYQRSVRIGKMAGDIFIPKELETFWMVKYHQDRTNPRLPDP